ncbi:MAG: extracellular solute-binding protein [Clostridia bacterium]|nr:extracellular solute-binding protein [Clostridia bacterium]
MKRLITGFLAAMILLGGLSFAWAERTFDVEPDAKLSYTYWGSAFEKEAQAKACEAFTELTGIPVDALHIPSAGDEYMTKLTAMTASGTNPDVGYMSASTAFVWAADGTFYNIFDLIDQDPTWSKESYIDNIFYMYDEGKSFGTTSSINPRAIFYNVECFEEAGVPLPPTDVEESWTWDEFVECAKKLTLDFDGKNATEEGFNPDRVMQYGAFINVEEAALLATFFDSNEGDMLNVEGTAMAMSDPAVKEVLQAWYDLIYVHHVTPFPDFANAPDGPTLLANKQAAMILTGQWVLLDLARLEFEYGVGQLPVFKTPRNSIDAGVRCIWSNTKYPKASWELYKFLANPEGAMSLYHDGLWMPTIREWYTDAAKYELWAVGNPAHPDGYKPVVADSLFNGTATPSWTLRIKNFAQLWAVMRPALQQIWLDTKSVDDVVAEIEEAANPLVQGFNPDTYHTSYYHQ